MRLGSRGLVINRSEGGEMLDRGELDEGRGGGGRGRGHRAGHCGQGGPHRRGRGRGERREGGEGGPGRGGEGVRLDLDRGRLGREEYRLRRRGQGSLGDQGGLWVSFDCFIVSFLLLISRNLRVKRFRLTFLQWLRFSLGF